MLKSHYYDYAATSPLLPEAYDAMVEAMQLNMSGQLGNPSSLHTPGHRAHDLIEDARAAIAALINADPSEIIFTSGATEANNTVMHIFAGRTILTSDIEHPSVLESAKAYGQLETINMWDFCRTDTQSAALAKLANPDIALWSFMLANNETGEILPVKTLAKKAHQRGAYFHTDATQALGKIPIDVRALDVDYLSASAHKLGGPIGIGFLYVKQGAPYAPLLYGGHQESRRRAGTSQFVNIAGFGAAAHHARKHQTWRVYGQRIKPLRDRLAQRILAEIPHSHVNVIPDFATLPHILNVSFAAAEGESIQLYLDLEGNIQVSTGSACATGDGQPSHVLMSLTHDAEIAHSSIRFSFSLYTTEEDIDHIMTTLPPIIQRLQGISTIKINSSDTATGDGSPTSPTGSAQHEKSTASHRSQEAA